MFGDIFDLCIVVDKSQLAKNFTSNYVFLTHSWHKFYLLK